MLLAHEVPEAALKWFRGHDILVKHCLPRIDTEIGGRPPVLADKVCLFSTDFKRWDTIVYTDADVIVRGGLTGLTGLGGFAGVLDWNPYLRLQILPAMQREKQVVRGRHTAL